MILDQNRQRLTRWNELTITETTAKRIADGRPTTNRLIIEERIGLFASKIKHKRLLNGREKLEFMPRQLLSDCVMAKA